MKLLKKVVLSNNFTRRLLLRTLVFLLSKKKQKKPILHQKDRNKIGVCSLVSHSHVDMFILNISSFFYFTNSSLPIHLIDDGTLTQADYKKLKKMFDVRITNLQRSGEKMRKLTRKYKFIRKFRFDEKAYFLKYKLDAILTNPFKKFIYIDADILFFKKPNEIITWINNEVDYSFYTAHIPYEMDMFSYYHDWIIHSHRMLLVDKYKTKIDPTFNAGMFCIHAKKAMSLSKVDDAFKFLYKNFFAHHFIAEETGLMQLIVDTKYKKLPVKKYLNIWCYEEYIKKDPDKTVLIHYAGTTKKVYWATDIVKSLISTNFFTKSIF